MADIHGDVLVVGGSLGGVSAAIRAAALGAQVHLLAEIEWIGGQMTAQGVSTPDEWEWIEQGGCTESYQEFRRRVRAHYTSLPLSTAGQQQARLNPGSCWVSGLSMEPRVGEAILREMLAEQPGVTLHTSTTATSAEMDGDRVTAINAVGPDGASNRFLAPMVIDATDLGDLLPLTGAEWVIGAEAQSDTGEPDAPPEAHPDWVQPFTMPIALELHPRGDDSPIPQPANYDALKQMQEGFGFADGAIAGLFGEQSWWNYRRIIAARNFSSQAFPYDIAEINTKFNDFNGGVIPSGSPDGDPSRDAELMAQARQVSVAYLYWLQNECKFGGRTGFPELHPATGIFGTDDAVSLLPYIRESRRLRALGTVREQDIVARDNSGAAHQRGVRARFFADSCGIGKYYLDVHGGPTPDRQLWLETKPYQIPLGCLVPARLTNLLAGCKNLGVTHLTNGAYRLHPVEWNIGEAAGALAAYCIQQDTEPHAVHSDDAALWSFQRVLLDVGVPLYWWPDVPPGHPAFAATQAIAMKGYWMGAAALIFRPDDPLTSDVRQAVNSAVGESLPWPTGATRAEAARWLAEHMQLLG